MKCLENNKLKIQPEASLCSHCLTSAIILSNNTEFVETMRYSQYISLLSLRHLMIYSDRYLPTVLRSVFLRNGAKSGRSLVLQPS